MIFRLDFNSHGHGNVYMNMCYEYKDKNGIYPFDLAWDIHTKTGGDWDVECRITDRLLESWLKEIGVFGVIFFEEHDNGVDYGIEFECVEDKNRFLSQFSYCAICR